jgi:hypothetical protein
MKILKYLRKAISSLNNKTKQSNTKSSIQTNISICKNCCPIDRANYCKCCGKILPKNTNRLSQRPKKKHLVRTSTKKSLNYLKHVQTNNKLSELISLENLKYKGIEEAANGFESMYLFRDLKQTKSIINSQKQIRPTHLRMKKSLGTANIIVSKRHKNGFRTSTMIKAPNKKETKKTTVTFVVDYASTPIKNQPKTSTPRKRF